MKLKRNSLLLLLLLLVSILGLSGCGSSSYLASNDFYEKNKDSVEERVNGGEESEETGIEKIYNNTMRKIETNDYEELKGSNVFDKLNRIFLGGSYRVYLAVRGVSPILLIIGWGIGASMFAFCKRNKHLKRSGIVLIVFSTFFFFSFWIGGALLNKMFLY